MGWINVREVEDCYCRGLLMVIVMCARARVCVCVCVCVCVSAVLGACIHVPVYVCHLTPRACCDPEHRSVIDIGAAASSGRYLIGVFGIDINTDFVLIADDQSTGVTHLIQG